MMKHDLSCWPLVLSFSQGAPSLDDLQQYSFAWTEWFERGERFAVLRILLDHRAQEHPPGGALARKTWLSSHGDRLKAQVVGLATVAPAEGLEHMNKIKADRLFGVPAQAFGGVNEALAWVLPLLAQEATGLEPEGLTPQVLARCQSMRASFIAETQEATHAQ